MYKITYMDPTISEFEKLIVWFEKADDPWFDEKRSSKLRDLQAMQRYFCPVRPR